MAAAEPRAGHRRMLTPQSPPPRRRDYSGSGTELCGPALSHPRLYCHPDLDSRDTMEPVPVATDGGDRPAAPSGLSASQRRAELRRRKLLMNSEQRINRIMGFHRPGSGAGESFSFPSPAHLFESSRSFCPLQLANPLTPRCTLTELCPRPLGVAYRTLHVASYFLGSSP